MGRDLSRALRSSGVDVVTVAEMGMRGQADVVVLEAALAQGRVVYTCNIGDYNALHTIRARTGTPHAGIIANSDQRMSVGEQARRILRILDAHSAAEMENRMEWLGAWIDDR